MEEVGRADATACATHSSLAGVPAQLHGRYCAVVSTRMGSWALTTYSSTRSLGAGTTVLAAKELGIPGVGFDLSPFAILVAHVKVATHHLEQLTSHWNRLKGKIKVAPSQWGRPPLRGACSTSFPGKKLATFHGVKASIEDLDASADVKSFLLLALLAQIPKFSNAVPTGGWLSWTPNRRPAAKLVDDLADSIRLMFDDVRNHLLRRQIAATYKYQTRESCRLPAGSCSAVITSPPYPNRHDYTRVFGVELMFGFLDWEGIRKLRYQTVHSHPESKPTRPPRMNTRSLPFISKAIRNIAKNEDRKRIVSMLRGYFLDLFISLKEVSRVLKRGGHAAFVLGNAQYNGVPFEVDRATGIICDQAGLECEEIRIVRKRGNSAQQMKSHGRRPSRESVVMIRKP